jgi:hypothetical protein
MIAKTLAQRLLVRRAQISTGEPAIRQANSLAASVILANSRCLFRVKLTLLKRGRKYPCRRKGRPLLQKLA